MGIRISEAHAARLPPAALAPAFALAILAVGVAGYFGLPRAQLSLPVVEGCRLEQQACTSALPDGSLLHVALDPRPMPSSGPLRISVRLGGAQADRVDVDFEGVEMNMGRHRVPLADQGGGHFSGETTLPVCVTGRMLWQATVRVGRGREDLAVPFRFESGRA